uniref:NAD-specific glutamate dehydrogenase n=1 Tax=Myoviridae sp. ct7eg16 TaxID=2826619 RepID=A0A8S5QL55_9CAUD|nr:MAG TPA: hypothetical protein [Myoviridae sp. ct7eg16]
MTWQAWICAMITRSSRTSPVGSGVISPAVTVCDWSRSRPTRKTAFRTHLSRVWSSKRDAPGSDRSSRRSAIRSLSSTLQALQTALERVDHRAAFLCVHVAFEGLRIGLLVDPGDGVGGGELAQVHRFRVLVGLWRGERFLLLFVGHGQAAILERRLDLLGEAFHLDYLAGLEFQPGVGDHQNAGTDVLDSIHLTSPPGLRNQFDLGHDVRAGNALADFGPHQPAGLEAGLLIDGLRLQVFAHRHLSDLFIRDDDDLVQRHGGGQQNAAGAVVLDDTLLAQLELGLGIEVPAAHVVEPAAAHDDVLHRQLQVLDDRDGFVQRLFGEQVAGDLDGVGRRDGRGEHRDGAAVHLLADGVGGAGLDIHQRADVAVLEDGHVHHRIGVDAISWELDFVLAHLLLLGVAVLADPVGLDGRFLLVNRTFALGQRVLGEQQRGDLLALDLLFDGRGNGGGKRPHAFGRLESLAHEPRHGFHVLLGVDLQLIGFHVRWLLGLDEQAKFEDAALYGNGVGDHVLSGRDAVGQATVRRNFQVVSGDDGPFEDVGLVDAAIAVDTGHFATGVVLDQDAEGALGGIGVDGEQVVADHADHLAELTVALDVAVAIGEAAVTRIDE